MPSRPPRHRLLRSFAATGTLAALSLWLCGCVSERSIRWTAGDIAALHPIAQDAVVTDTVSLSERAADSPVARSTGSSPTVREWLIDAHAQLQSLWPEGEAPALLTEDLTGEHRPAVNVYEHFKREPESLNSIVKNWNGMIDSARCGGRPYRDYVPVPDWAGFENVQVPTADGEWIVGRLGWSRGTNGDIQTSDCILLLPGYDGHNAVLRTSNLAQGLLDCGFHVLALEPRGHGATEARRPDLAYTFGVIESTDVLWAAAWMEAKPHVRATGAVGSSWGANLALLAAWYDARKPSEPDIHATLAARMPAVPPGPHLQAGIVAMSCMPRFEQLIDYLDTPRHKFSDPGPSNVQRSIRRRMIDKGGADRSGSLRRLIAFEFSRSALNYPDGVEDGMAYLRIVPHGGDSVSPKLESSRVPILFLHGANDPLVPVGDVADLLRGVHNPNVAAVILPGGGHVGFFARAPRYTASLIVNFLRTHGGQVPSPAVVAAR